MAQNEKHPGWDRNARYTEPLKLLRLKLEEMRVLVTPRLDQLIFELDSEPDDTPKERIAYYGRLRCEAQELITIYNDYPEALTANLWKRILDERSCADPFMEPSNFTTSRDRQFEAWLTAFLMQRGIRASWCRENPDKQDVEMNFEGADVAISAKRPRDSNSIVNCIKDALRELDAWIKKVDQPALLAVSLDRIWSQKLAHDRLEMGFTDELRQTMSDFWLTIRRNSLTKARTFQDKFIGLMVVTKTSVIERLGGREVRYAVITQYHMDEASSIRGDKSRKWMPFLARLSEALRADDRRIVTYD